MSESARYDNFARNFRNPFRITLNPPTISDPYAELRTQHPLLSLSPSFAQNFYLKDAALYNLSIWSYDIEDAFDEVWKIWYTRRNLQLGMQTEAVFCRAMKPKTRSEVLSVPQTVHFHECLVRAVDAHERSLVDWKKLNDTFRRVIIILDKEEWERDGVLVICRVDSVADHGLQDLPVETMEGMNGWLAFRRSLGDAVKTVICDPERIKAHTPIEEGYEEKRFQL